jgi:hypothetical protein
VCVSDVFAIIDEWRNHYPEDIFPREGTSPECKAAFMARFICEGIARDVMALPQVSATSAAASATEKHT